LIGNADEDEDDEEGAEDMKTIETSNIIPSGRRTRGKTIDFVKAAAEAGDELPDDEDDDGDFVAAPGADDDEDDAMEE
jgi:hypothetical protein